MIVLKPDKAEAKRGRDHVVEIAAAESWPVDPDGVRVVAGELINNAIGHAATHEIRVEAYSDEDESEGLYVVEVWDADDAKRPESGRPHIEEECGRGLRLVTALTNEWGVRVVGDWDGPPNDYDGGKTVFAAWLVRLK